MNQTQFSKFSFDTVLVLLESSDRFPVDFDAAWQWLGYHRKDAAKEKLTRNFERDFDYSAIWRSVAHSSGFTASKTEVIMLSIDCFKQLGMMAGTEKGKQVRRYFLECERQLKETLVDDSIMLKVLEHRLVSRFERPFVAIEDRLQQLENQLNSRGKLKLAALPTDKKYLYTSTRRISQCQLILDFLEQQRGEKFGADGLAQRLNIPSSSARRVLLIAYRRGLIDREFNPKYNHQKKGVPEYFYFVL